MAAVGIGASRLGGSAWSGTDIQPLLLVGIGTVVAAIARVIIGPAVVVATVIRRDLVQTLVASDHVESPFRVEIGSQITGTVEDVLVEEGQLVSQGQVLLLTIVSGRAHKQPVRLGLRAYAAGSRSGRWNRNQQPIEAASKVTTGRTRRDRASRESYLTSIGN